MLSNYPHLARLVEILDNYLEEKHPSFFGAGAIHPVLPVKRSKILNDNLWGTNRFHWRELVLIDSPVFQRLRDIHQTGLAYLVYMSAHHTRFEHSLGVVTLASRIFDQILARNYDEVRNIVQSVHGGEDTGKVVSRVRQELRLAALLHDMGHSLFSHTSERVYEKLDLLEQATNELYRLTGKEKGASEAISFCFALTRSVPALLARVELTGPSSAQDYDGEIDFQNVALFIVGRSRHPLFQFCGDIISSGLDADKLDYLLRDATSAGLPWLYDIERYLHCVEIEKGHIPDGENFLLDLFRSLGTGVPRIEPGDSREHASYESYRLRLPKKAMNTIEQIFLCKLMLFSYVYHHQKVRAAEGMLQRLLDAVVSYWKSEHESDAGIVGRFLDMTDSALYGALCCAAAKAGVQEDLYRIVNRLLPREVYSLSGTCADVAEKPLLTDFLTDLCDRTKRDDMVRELETEIGNELMRVAPALGPNAREALRKAGVWFDVPKPPSFEDVNEVTASSAQQIPGVSLDNMFPVADWTAGYTTCRYQVRIFAFSEYVEMTTDAAKKAMQRVLKIRSESFFNNARRSRS